MGTFLQLFLNPAIISLFAGLVLGLFFEITLPALIIDFVSYYLIFTIGFKGGACLGVVDQCSIFIINLAIAGLIVGFIQPFLNYYLLRRTTNLNKENAIVVSSQYGSISIVTFITGISFLTSRSIYYDTFMSAVAGMMEIPALFSGLYLLNRDSEFNKNFLKSTFNILKSIFACKKISMIFLGFLVGIVFKRFDFIYLDKIIIAPFNYILIAFMFDIGLNIAKQRSHIKNISKSLIAFGIYMPIIMGIFGVILASLFVKEVGTVFLFALLLASASYIAVPAVMRAKVRGANEAIYMPLALGVTLPFNIFLGIPIFYKLSEIVIIFFK